MQIDLLSLRVLWVGIGCQKGISSLLINTAIEKIFRENQLSRCQISGIATIESKVDEEGLKDFCQVYNLSLKTFTAENLSKVQCVPHPAKIVSERMGTPSVAEASAILAASEITSVGVRLLVPKQIFRLPGEVGTVTIAIAQTVI
ncbi:cobalamin biosynthesis protein [Anabaena lutea]|uniref:Cobalamin biosynthesis protein n=1 Tax=Anabaena lutea FACHB-196 TaxID=2692881 RepID=A0ABR8FJ91_9NOST|nr:cobalamin biosynthesis protein [Anabaena lutea]MBD2569004.1 cobalamin biosynthesis protein [Anabaena lutea FACHB-196]